jgi:hypothetical protein
MIKSRRMILTGHVACMGRKEMHVGYWLEIQKEGKSRHRWKDNTKMEFREIRWGGMVWIELHQNRDQWRALVD